MSNSYYTQTKNFMSSLNDEVDPRTGLYSVSINLGNVIGNNGSGPEIPLTLSYSPTSSANIGFGIGFGTSLTVYDKANFYLTLNTGEQYVINESGSTITVKEMKLKTFVMTKSGTGYLVAHKDGNCEVLTLVCNNLYLPTKVLSPTGHYLTLTWDGTSGTPRLTKIVDMNNDAHCTVTYSGNTTMKFLPNNSEGYTLILASQNNFLNTITRSNSDTSLQWKLNYTTGIVTGISQTVTGMTTPLGLVKSVQYEKGLMKFPTSAGQAALPAVTKYTIEPGMEQPNLVRTYTYGGSDNYLGYGGAGAWAATSDFTYTLPASYQYESTETVVDAGSSTSLSTRRVYNHYHLMTLSEEKQGSQNKQTELTYYEESGKTFDNQPAQLQCLKVQKVTWINGSEQYSETTTTEYDVNGNLIKQVDPSGTVTETEYYPATGEAHPTGDVDCPADPHGFVRYVKSRKITPAQSSFDAPVQLTYGKFAKQVTLNNTGASYSVVPVKTTRMRDGVSNLVREMDYYESTGDNLNFGRLKTATLHLVSPDVKTSSNVFSYEKSDESLIHTRTFSGHDNTSQTTVREHSRFTNKLWSFINTQKIKTALTYDWLGRLTQRVINPDNEYANTLTISYGIASSEISTTYTDNEKNAHIKYFDRLGRVISEWVNNKDNDAVTFYQIKENTYDASNRLKESHNIDYKDPRDISTKMLITQSAKFDNWGQNYLNILNSGQQSQQQFDPIGRVSLQQLQVTSGGSLKLGSQNSLYNSMNLVQQIDKMTASNTLDSSQVQLYDGLGRIRQYTDAKYNVTQYTYDVFDRVITQTLPDGTVIAKTYDANSTDELITSISVTPKGEKTILMGTQTFDGLGRLTLSSSGGRSQSYTYTDARIYPAVSSDTLGNQLTYAYIAELDDAVSSVKSSSGKIDQSFAYESATGRMLEAHEKDGQSTMMTWWPTGELEREMFMLGNNTALSADYQWTLQGQPLKYTDVAGNLQTMDYDQYGRIITITDPQVTVHITYDAAGRVSTQNAVAAGGDTLLTTITWDDFSRETQRVIKPSSGNTLTVTQTYTKNDLMQTRQVSSGSQLLRDETFTYDVRNRLTTYECNGSSPAVDGYGQPIASQTFTLDALSNITQCVTVIANGGTDTANYLFENPQDPTQLTQVKHSLTAVYPAKIVLQYDVNGRMTCDEAGRTLSYDEAGRLIEITDENNNTLSTYGYDAMNTLVTQSLADDDVRQLFYTGSRLVSEASSKKQTINRYIPGSNGSAAVSEDSFVN